MLPTCDPSTPCTCWIKTDSIATFINYHTNIAMFNSVVGSFLPTVVAAHIAGGTAKIKHDLESDLRVAKGLSKNNKTKNLAQSEDCSHCIQNRRRHPLPSNNSQTLDLQPDSCLKKPVKPSSAKVLRESSFYAS